MRLCCGLLNLRAMRSVVLELYLDIRIHSLPPSLFARGSYILRIYLNAIPPREVGNAGSSISSLKRSPSTFICAPGLLNR
jgi:hypothetical protein